MVEVDLKVIIPTAIIVFIITLVIVYYYFKVRFKVNLATFVKILNTPCVFDFECNKRLLCHKGRCKVKNGGFCNKDADCVSGKCKDGTCVIIKI